jgi:hypothetical protein
LKELRASVSEQCSVVANMSDRKWKRIEDAKRQAKKHARAKAEELIDLSSDERDEEESTY